MTNAISPSRAFGVLLGCGIILIVVMASLISRKVVEPAAFDLPSGYVLARGDKADESWFIISSLESPRQLIMPGIAVPQSIVKVAVVNSIVYGLIEYEPLASLSRRDAVGWFLLNTMSHQVMLGLTMEELVSKLEKEGIAFTHDILRSPANLTNVPLHHP